MSHLAPKDPADRPPVGRMGISRDALRLALGHVDQAPQEARAACLSRCALRMESRSTPSRSMARSREHQRPVTFTSVSSRYQERPAWPRRFARRRSASSGALADTLELENTVPRTRALTQLVSVAARVQETTEWEARLRALEDGVWRETPDAGP